MVLNKKGAAGLVIFMIGIVFFLLALALSPLIADASYEASHTQDFNCSSTTLSDQDQAVCTQIDSFTPLFFGLVAGLAAVLIGRAVL